MNRITAFLRSPYPTSGSARVMFTRSVLFGVFVFLFLLLFQPFGLNQIKGRFLTIIAGYGLICTVVMSFLNVLIPALFRNYFNERKWTSGREIFWTLVNIGLIGLANALYSSYLGMFTLDMTGILTFEVYTFLIGLIPVTIGVLLKRKKLEKEFRAESETINSGLQYPKTPENDMIEIHSEYAGESVIVRAGDLLFVRAADNYAEVFFTEQGTSRQKMLRKSLKDIENAFRAFPQLFRCHKSYIVNLRQVRHVSGNAQGLKLHLNHSDELVPVSRNHTKTIRNRLTVRP